MSFASFDPSLPLSQAKTLPSTCYFEKSVFDQERKSLLHKTWQYVGPASSLNEPLSYMTCEIAGEPLLLTKTADETIHAFYNVCRHRGAPVVEGACGKGATLRCRYHGWNYGIDGKLIGAPEFQGVESFNPSEIALPKAAIGIWNGLIFVHLDKPQLSLEEYLAPVTKRMKQYPFPSIPFHSRRSYPIACNWKVFVDNYLDGGYHVATVHPSLAGAIDYKNYRNVEEGLTSVQISPLLNTTSRKREDAAVDSVRTGDAAYYWWLFPNLMLNLYEGILDINYTIPTGPESCNVIFDYFFSKDLSPDLIEKSLAVAHQVQLEDQEICEKVQKGLRSRSYSTGRFSVKRESSGYYFHQLFAKALAKDN